MLITFQWVFLGVAVLASIGGVYLKIRKSWSARALLLWLCFWCLATLVTLWPESASRVAETFGIGRGADLVVYAAITLIFALLFRAEVHFDRLERQLTSLVRELALRDISKK